MLCVEQSEAVMANAEPIDNRLFVLILQHPQEKKEALATAAVTHTLLRRAELAVGLSWPNLSRALGHPADPQLGRCSISARHVRPRLAISET